MLSCETKSTENTESGTPKSLSNCFEVFDFEKTFFFGGKNIFLGTFVFIIFFFF